MFVHRLNVYSFAFVIHFILNDGPSSVQLWYLSVNGIIQKLLELPEVIIKHLFEKS